MYVYPIPNPLASDREARRYAHEDLAGLSDLQLWQEEKRLEFVIAWSDGEPDPWLVERYKRVKAEQKRRGRP